MNKNGFTLTEVIVVIVLIGIISTMVFASIGKLQTQNSKKIYEEYEEALKVASKLYIDKYNRDIWGTNEGGCKSISFYNLYQERLVKDFFGKKTEELDKDRTFVNITKNNSSKEVTYQVYLVIKRKNNSKIIYESENRISRCPSA